VSIYDDLESKSDEELVRITERRLGGDPVTVAVGQLLQLRNAKRQVEAGNALVRATEKLGRATWVLALITLLMLVTSVAQVYLAYKGVKLQAAPADPLAADWTVTTPPIDRISQVASARSGAFAYRRTSAAVR